jgi:hypothetical protein
MLTNYLLLAFRNIAKQRTYTMVNGLASAAAMFILLYVRDESTFDTMHPSVNETYRMGLRGNFQQLQKTVSTLRASRMERLLTTQLPKHRWYHQLPGCEVSFTELNCQYCFLSPLLAQSPSSRCLQ